MGLAAGFLLPVAVTAHASAANRKRIPVNAAVVFSDDPLMPGVTLIKAVHLTGLRDAVNAARATAGLPAAAPFTDLSPAGATVKVVHITELRTALDEARSARSLPQFSYTDPMVTAGTAVKAVHFQELREAARRVVDGCPAITVASPSQTTFTVNTALMQAFTQSGGASGATFTIAGGMLPGGLTLSASGILSGTPMQSGSFPITVRATDRYGCSGTSGTYPLSIVPPPAIFTFTGPTGAVAAGSTITLTGTFADGTGLITNDQNSQSIVAVSGTGHQVTMPAVNTIFTLTVTNAAGNQVQASLTIVIAAVLRINEVNANITNSCDLIEVRVVSGGSMKGLIIRERTGASGELAYTFPAFTVQKNDFIVIHTISGMPATCNPNMATQEINSPAEQSSTTFGGNFDTAYDFWAPDNGLTNTDNVFTVRDANNTIIDALFVSDDPAATSTAAPTEIAAAEVGSANQWSPAMSSYIDTVFRMNAVDDLNATGTLRTGTSIQRLDDTDDNNKADWTTGAGSTQSFGLINAGQSPF